MINHYQSNLDYAHTFLASQSHLLGSIWAASGIRRTGAGVLLDWALVDLGDRPCLSNTVNVNRSEQLNGNTQTDH